MLVANGLASVSSVSSVPRASVSSVALDFFDTGEAATGGRGGRGGEGQRRAIIVEQACYLHRPPATIGLGAPPSLSPLFPRLLLPLMLVKLLS